MLRRRMPGRRVAGPASALIAVLAAAGALAGCAGERPASYVDARLCAACHPAEAERWRGSHHERAMAAATPASVLGDFSGAAFEDTRFLRDGDAYVIEVAASAPGAAAPAPPTRHRVRYTFGVAPLQQYLVELPGGRLQASAHAWDTTKQAWFRVQASELPWTSRYHTWNTMCAECHSTAVDKRYDPARDRFDTRYEEVSVGCQACHGPGSRHVMDPQQPLATSAEVEACAPCHARRSAITAGAPPPGAPLFDHYRPMTLQPGLYFPDGQILDEVFEYGSFAQSVMHERGVRCVDCHDPHSARAEPDNATCMRCHGASPPPARFPGLAVRARDLDSPAHHHHTPGNPGARCVSCHMPERTYMKVDGRRDHSFRIPRPDLSVALGTPNACNQACHADRDPAWAAAAIAAWFPGDRPAHYGEVFARAQRGEPVATDLQRLATARGQPAIVRATALELLLGDPPACLATAHAALRDPSPLVRSVALACAEHLAPAARAELAGPALRDPARLVRIEAARVLAGPAVAALPAALHGAFTAARRELEDAFRGELDRPEGWFNLAVLAEAEARRDQAIAHYRKALAIDPDFVPARANLGQLERARP
jgi:Cytochrome c554 and c-prime